MFYGDVRSSSGTILRRCSVFCGCPTVHFWRATCPHLLWDLDHLLFCLSSEVFGGEKDTLELQVFKAAPDSAF